MSKFIPNSFQVPNVLVDEYITELSSHSFKLLIFIIRKTKGWQKQKDTIPTTQFAKALGLKKTRHVYPYIAELEALNLIKVHKKLGKTNQYSLGKNFDKPVTKKGSTQTGTSDEKGQYPVTEKGSGTSDEKGQSSKDINKTTINKQMFLNFWERYKGSKREPKTEYEAFQKMHKDWQEILPKFEDVILDNSIDEDYIPKLKNYLWGREWESAKRVKAKQWWDSRQGQAQKGKEYGLKVEDYSQYHQFLTAVKSKAKQNGELVYE